LPLWIVRIETHAQKGRRTGPIAELLIDMLVQKQKSSSLTYGDLVKRKRAEYDKNFGIATLIAKCSAFYPLGSVNVFWQFSSETAIEDVTIFAYCLMESSDPESEVNRLCHQVISLVGKRTKGLSSRSVVVYPPSDEYDVDAYSYLHCNIDQYRLRLWPVIASFAAHAGAAGYIASRLVPLDNIVGIITSIPSLGVSLIGTIIEHVTGFLVSPKYGLVPLFQPLREQSLQKTVRDQRLAEGKITQQIRGKKDEED